MNIFRKRTRVFVFIAAILLTAINTFALSGIIQKGDVNSDGKVDIVDVTTTISHILGQASDKFNMAAADANSDSKVDIVDVTTIIDIILNGTTCQDIMSLWFADDSPNTEIPLAKLPKIVFDDDAVTVTAPGIDLKYKATDLCKITYSNTNTETDQETASSRSNLTQTSDDEEDNVPMVHVSFTDNTELTLERSTLQSISFDYQGEEGNAPATMMQTLKTADDEYKTPIAEVESIVFSFPGSESDKGRKWVRTRSPINVTRLTATLRGKCSNLLDMDDYGFIIFASDRENQIISKEQISTHGNRSFQYTLDILPNKAYSYCAYAIKGHRQYRGAYLWFFSKQLSVSTLNITEDTEDRLCGKVTDGTEELENAHKGILLWEGTATTAAEATNMEASWDETMSKGCFSADRPGGLKPNTYYCYQAYVELNGVYTYGGLAFFKTGSTTVVTYQPKITDNTYVSLRGSVEGVSSVSDNDAVGFLIDTNGTFSNGDYMAFSVGKLADQANMTFTDTYRGFTPDVTYYYRAVAVIGGSTYLGKIKSFTLQSQVTESAKIITGDVQMDEDMPYAYLTIRLLMDKSDLPEKYDIGFFYNKTGNPNLANAQYVVLNNDNWAWSLTDSHTLKLKDTWEGNTRYFVRAFLATTEGILYGNEVTVLTLPHIGPTKGQVIDMGLSVKWAGWNIGAESPEQSGSYFAWGETESKETFSSTNYRFYKGWPAPVWKDLDDAITDISGTKYDAAHVQWGGTWRIPTRSELEELVSRCTIRSVYEYKSTIGILFIGPNGNSIFLPEAGIKDEKIISHFEYRSSTITEETDETFGHPYVYSLKDGSLHGEENNISNWISNRGDRCFGLPIRAVCQ